MFGMGLTIVLGSLGMIFTTMLSPKEMPFEDKLGSSIQWGGPRYGNTFTCTLQGFLTTFGPFALLGYNITLCMYYASTIALQMNNVTIRKYVQPVVLGLPIVMGGFRAFPPLFQEMYNPGTTAIFGPQRTVIAPWCQYQPYPTGCKDDECIRGSSANFDYALKSLTWTMSIGFSITFVSLTLVICRVLYNERLLRRAVKCTKDDEPEKVFHMNTSGYDTGSRNSDDPDLEISERRARDAHLTNKVIIAQCFGYLANWVVGISFMLLTSASDEVRFSLMLVFLPGQGFFCMIIFVSHKVYNYWRLHREESICDVLGILFTESVQEPCFISRISIVEEELGHRRTLALYQSKVFQHPDLLQDASRKAFSDDDNDESDNSGFEDRSQKKDADLDIADIADLSGFSRSSMSDMIADDSRLSLSIGDDHAEKPKVCLSANAASRLDVERGGTSVPSDPRLK